LDDAQAQGSPGSAGAAPLPPDPEPVGLRAEIRAVVAAIRRLLTAHIDLAKAEAGEIGAEIGRVALLAGVAIGALLALALFLPIGLLLYLGDLIFGSIGWGLLLGSMVLIDVAVLAALVAVGVPRARIGQSLLIALGIGIVILAMGMLLRLALQPWAALSVFAALVAWPVAAGFGIARHGIDTEALKARFYPNQTIETTKETIEWVRERLPLGRKS
jgi:hypothetical protein